MEWRVLDRKTYASQSFMVQYEAKAFYHVESIPGTSEFLFHLEKKPLAKPVFKSFTLELYPDYFPEAVAYGLFDKGLLVGLIELNEEKWNQRIRITEIWVHEQWRRQGIGKELIHHAYQIALSTGKRMVILETQSTNIDAIEFYLACGFSLIGMDLYCYSNQDPLTKEVRLEMGRMVLR